EADRAIKGFLYPRMYRHSRIMRIMGDAERLVCALFARYLEQPDDMPAEWAEIVDGGDAAARSRHIADFIAGMTDRYTLMEQARLFASPPELRQAARPDANTLRATRTFLPPSWTTCAPPTTRWSQTACCLRESTSRASWSSRRARARTATWRPMRPWCWLRMPARSRAHWPKRSRRNCAATIWWRRPRWRARGSST